MSSNLDKNCKLFVCWVPSGITTGVDFDDFDCPDMDTHKKYPNYTDILDIPEFVRQMPIDNSNVYLAGMAFLWLMNKSAKNRNVTSYSIPDDYFNWYIIEIKES